MCGRDWSSDVCSSDLSIPPPGRRLVWLILAYYLLNVIRKWQTEWFKLISRPMNDLSTLTTLDLSISQTTHPFIIADAATPLQSLFQYLCASFITASANVIHDDVAVRSVSAKNKQVSLPQWTRATISWCNWTHSWDVPSSSGAVVILVHHGSPTSSLNALMCQYLSAMNSVYTSCELPVNGPRWLYLP